MSSITITQLQPVQNTVSVTETVTNTSVIVQQQLTVNNVVVSPLSITNYYGGSGVTYDLIGIPDGSLNLGTFTPGVVIQDNQTVYDALDDLDQNLSTLNTNVSTNTSTLSSATTDISNLQSDLTGATGDIATNASNISSNTSQITTNTGNITSNAGDIGVLQGGLAQEITDRTTADNALQSQISTNISDISSNNSSISTNAGNIATNTSSIASNLSEIQSNDTDIATNAGNITTNANAIAAIVSADGSIDTHSDVDTTTVTPVLDQVLIWNGTNWVPGEGGSSDVVLVEVKNDTATDFDKGQPVYVSGTHTSGKPTVELADNNGSNTYPSIGLLQEDLVAGAEGFVVVAGSLFNVDTSAYSAGDALYLSSTAGDLDNSRPAGPVQVQKVALVKRSHPSAGSLIVMGAGRTNDVPNIPNGEFWIGDATGVAVPANFNTSVGATPSVTANSLKISADGTVTTHNDVTSAGSGAIITTAERTKLVGLSKYHGVLLDGASGGVSIGSGTINFAVGDRFANKGTVASDGFYEVTSAFTYTKQSGETNAQLEFNSYSSSYQTVASAADLSLADLAASSSTDVFSDSLQTWQLTTSSNTLFITPLFIVQGVSSFSGNLGVTGNITVTGTVDGIDIGTDVAANTAKVSFPGFGTTAGTALEGDTALFSGVYADLTGKPTIPTNNNQLTNGAGYITGYVVTQGDVTAHQAALSIAYSQLTSVPTTFAPSAHTHTASEITDFDTEVSNNTSVAANTAKITFPGFGTTAGTALEGNTSLFDGAYASLTGTPSTFTPSAHTHTASEITDFDTEVSNNSSVTANTAKTSFPGFGTTAGTALEGSTSLFDGAYSSLTGIPSTFTPSSHTHTASEITDFDTEVSNNTSVAANTAKTSFPGFTSLATDYSVTLATVATSGAYSDLTGTPNLATLVPYSGATGTVDLNSQNLIGVSSITSSAALFGNNPSNLRAFNVRGTGFDGRLSIQGGTGDQPGVEMTIDGNTSRVLMRMTRVGTDGTSLEFFTELDGGAIKKQLTLDDDGTLYVHNTDTKDSGIRNNSGTMQFKNTSGSWTNFGSGSGGGLADVVDDTTPQLGGNLDVNSNEIQSNGDLILRVDADNNTANSSFIVKNGAGLNMLALDEEGMTSITTGADNPLKLGNLDGSTSTFNCISLNGSTAYPGLIGFAAGSNSNDNFFMMGEIIDLRPDTANPITGAIRLQADPNNAGESVCTINHRSGSEPTTHSLAVKGTALISDDVDLSAALDVTGTLTASGLTYPTTDGTNGQVLSTNGSGTLSFVDAATGGGGGATPMVINYARMSMSSAVLNGGASQQDFTSPTDVDVQFDTQDDVTGTDITMNTSTYSMTVSTAGYYRLTCNMSFFSTGARTTPGIRFNINGTNIPGESMGYIRASSGQNENTNNLTRVIELSANDVITVCAHDESTVTGAIYAEQAIFEVEKLGGSVQQQTLEGTYLDFATTNTAYTATSYEGRVMRFGAGTLVANKAYTFQDVGGTGTWVPVDADAESTTKGLFGIALGTSPTTDGLLLRGTRAYNSSFSPGDTLYISLTEGEVTNDISSYVAGDFVRVVGYCLDSQIIYIDPSPDYIELA